MRNDISKNQNQQIPLEQGRAVEANASFKSLLDSFFDETTFDGVEDVLFDLMHEFLCPNDNEKTQRYISDTLYDVRRISNLIRKLELAHNQWKGGSSC
jgi:hypothetical protein